MNVQDVPIDKIQIKENHRTEIEKTEIHELMQSIKQHGLQQSIGVSKSKSGMYDLIFGQRRFLACKKLGWKKISAAIGDNVNETEMEILCLTENIQRKNPSFVEFGRSIERLMAQGLNIKEVSVRLGIPELKVKKMLETYKSLPEKHRKNVERVGSGKRKKNGKLTPLVANAIIRIKKKYGMNQRECDELIKYVVDTDMTHDDVKTIAVLMSAGLNYKQAIEKMYDYHVYNIDFIASKSDVIAHKRKINAASTKHLIKKIIYGEVPPLKKPEFIHI